MSLNKLSKVGWINLVFLILIAFIVTVFLPAPQVYACTPNPTPRFSIIIDSSYCFFYSSYENISADDDVVAYINNESRQPSDGCNDLVLNEKDQEIVRDVINERNKKRYFFSVIYLEKESDIEYADFQKFVTRINEDKCDCKSIGQITRYDGWTAYVESEACAHNTMCQRILPVCTDSPIITTAPTTTTAPPVTTPPPITEPEKMNVIDVILEDIPSDKKEPMTASIATIFVTPEGEIVLSYPQLIIPESIISKITEALAAAKSTNLTIEYESPEIIDGEKALVMYSKVVEPTDELYTLVLRGFLSRDYEWDIDIFDFKLVKADKWSAYNEDGKVLEFENKPGILTSTALLPPGYTPEGHPFLNGSVLVVEEESNIRNILDESSSFVDFMSKLVEKEYFVDITTVPAPIITTLPPTTQAPFNMTGLEPSKGICGPTTILLLALISGLGIIAFEKKRK